MKRTALLRKIPLRRKKKVSKSTKIKKVKRLTVSQAKKRAWRAFSLWVRMSNSAGGMVECYTCGKRVEWKIANAGHGIGGRNNSILFSEELTKTQCVGCNIWGRGKYAIFTRRLIDELGLKRYDELVTLSNQTVQYKVEDYLAIEERYKEKLKQYIV